MLGAEHKRKRKQGLEASLVPTVPSTWDLIHRVEVMMPIVGQEALMLLGAGQVPG